MGPGGCKCVTSCWFFVFVFVSVSSNSKDEIQVVSQRVDTHSTNCQVQLKPVQSRFRLPSTKHQIINRPANEPSPKCASVCVWVRGAGAGIQDSL